MSQVFENRKQAGRVLAERLKLLSAQDRKNAVIVALPRGGIPVADEIAKTFDLPLEVLVVRKIGHPMQPEYGIGAIAEGGFYWTDPDAVGISEISGAQIDQIVEKEKKEIERRVQQYRQNRSLPSFEGRTVILIDDGLATGVTARVAGQYAKAKGAKKVILAVPVCSARTATALRSEMDEVVCLNESSFFMAVGHFYRDFSPVSDAEAMEFLSKTKGVKAPGNVEHVIEKNAHPLRTSKDLAPIVEKLSQAKIVMLGESSHGTQEFYEWRRLISQELIDKHGFNFIAVEGDWPPCAELNRYIHLEAETENARETLKRFQRWPTWMWANTEIIKLADWMKTYNEPRPQDERSGFHGLDVYSLFESIDEIIHQLQKIDPALARRAQLYYACFDPFQKDEKHYAKSLMYIPEGCESQVLDALRDLLKVRLDGIAKERDRLFDAQQNARIVKNAEHYYRTMIHGDGDSWNVRDRHMMETLNLLLSHYGPESKGIVWAHNTHIGDYRATDMLQEGQINIGGLAREEWGEDRVALLGFGTYQGEVIASHAWDGPTETMVVPPGRSESYEALLHKAAANLNLNAFFIWLKDELKEGELSQVLGHRAIGVVYHPAYEKFGNYVPTSLSNRYDGFIFIDQSKALTPLKQKFIKEEIPETWPSRM